MHYTTTNIRLESNTLKELKHKAVEEGKRVAELIRDAIRQYLTKTKAKPVEHAGKDPLLSIIGICKTGTKEGSTCHDEFLYKK